VRRDLPTGALVVGVGGVLLVLAGLVAVLSRYSMFAPQEFGWFAYAASGGGDGPLLYVVTARDLWGVVALTTGLAAVAAATGYALGLRRTGGPSPSAAD
jgi:hypothetical protein